MGCSSYSTLPSSSLTRHVPQPPKVHSCAIRTLARGGVQHRLAGLGAELLAGFHQMNAISHGGSVVRLLLDVRGDHHLHAALGQHVGQRLQRRHASLGVLLAVAAAQCRRRR